MKMNANHSALSRVVFILVAFNGLFLFGNGLCMLVAPRAWYDFVPGVTDTGFFNPHFIRDIGLIQMFLGAVFGIGMNRPACRCAASRVEERALTTDAPTRQLKRNDQTLFS